MDAGKAQLLQAAGIDTAEQHRENAERPPFLRHAVGEIEPRQGAGLQKAQQQEIHKALSQRPERHDQKQHGAQVSQEREGEQTPEEREPRE